jgi:hypothetical protein
VGMVLERYTKFRTIHMWLRGVSSSARYAVSKMLMTC